MRYKGKEKERKRQKIQKDREYKTLNIMKSKKQIKDIIKHNDKGLKTIEKEGKREKNIDGSKRKERENAIY